MIKYDFPRDFLLHPILYIYVKWQLYLMDINDIFIQFKRQIDK